MNCSFFIRKRYESLHLLTTKLRIVTFSTEKIQIVTFFIKNTKTQRTPVGPKFFFKYNTYCILLKSMLSPVGHNFQPKEVMIANLNNLFICWPSKNRSDWWGSDPGFESCIYSALLYKLLTCFCFIVTRNWYSSC